MGKLAPEEREQFQAMLGKQGMTQPNFPKVWFASEQRVKSPTKFLVFDDRGPLDVSSEGIEFRGKRGSISISGSAIRDISISRQKLNWVTYLIVNALLVVYFLLTSTTIAFMLWILILGNGFGVLVSLSTKWVVVEYSGQDGILKKVHFADGSAFGWSGLFGGTLGIYREIRVYREIYRAGKT